MCLFACLYSSVLLNVSVVCLFLCWVFIVVLEGAESGLWQVLCTVDCLGMHMVQGTVVGAFTYLPDCLFIFLLYFSVIHLFIWCLSIVILQSTGSRAVHERGAQVS